MILTTGQPMWHRRERSNCEAAIGRMLMTKIICFSLSVGTRGRGVDEQTSVSGSHTMTHRPRAPMYRKGRVPEKSAVVPVVHAPTGSFPLFLTDLRIRICSASTSFKMYSGDDPELSFVGTEDEVAAVSKIQAMDRGKLARKELHEQNAAATKMQAVQRQGSAQFDRGGGGGRACHGRRTIRGDNLIKSLCRRALHFQFFILATVLGVMPSPCGHPFGSVHKHFVAFPAESFIMFASARPPDTAVPLPAATVTFDLVRVQTTLNI